MLPPDVTRVDWTLNIINQLVSQQDFLTLLVILPRKKEETHLNILL